MYVFCQSERWNFSSGWRSYPKPLLQHFHPCNKMLTKVRDRLQPSTLLARRSTGLSATFWLVAPYLPPVRVLGDLVNPEVRQVSLEVVSQELRFGIVRAVCPACGNTNRTPRGRCGDTGWWELDQPKTFGNFSTHTHPPPLPPGASPASTSLAMRAPPSNGRRLEASRGNATRCTRRPGRLALGARRPLSRGWRRAAAWRRRRAPGNGRPRAWGRCPTAAQGTREAGGGGRGEPSRAEPSKSPFTAALRGGCPKSSPCSFTWGVAGLLAELWLSLDFTRRWLCALFAGWFPQEEFHRVLCLELAPQICSWNARQNE